MFYCILSSSNIKKLSSTLIVHLFLQFCYFYSLFSTVQNSQVSLKIQLIFKFKTSSCDNLDLNHKEIFITGRLIRVDYSKRSRFHFSSMQSVVPVIPTSSRTRALTLCSLCGSCWLSPLMSSPLYDRSYERQIWWLKCFCSPVLETFTLTVELHFRAHSCPPPPPAASIPFDANTNDVPYLSAWWWLNSRGTCRHICTTKQRPYEGWKKRNKMSWHTSKNPSRNSGSVKN